MASKTPEFIVFPITDVEGEILPENMNRRMLYLKNRGEDDIYISKDAGFDPDANSLRLVSGESQIWTDDLCPANPFYAKCLTGLVSELEIEEF